MWSGSAFHFDAMPRKRLLSRLFIYFILTVSCLVTLHSRASTGSVTTSFINVGQGDSILLRDGTGFDVLIDGGTPEAGPKVVAYLRAQGVDDIDVMVSSHPDADHLGGLIDVLRMEDIPVLSVVYGGYAGTTATWSTFATAVAAEGLQMTPAQSPAGFIWGDMTVEVLNPRPGLTDPEPNNASVVLRVSHGEVTFLFTGDIDATQEAQIVSRSDSVAADVLKVAHHGSSSSSGAAFLAAVAPTDAVISVGPNSYGHPAADTLERLSAAGAQVWRTDLCGTMTVSSDGLAHALTCQFTNFLYLPLVARPPAETPPPSTSDLRITNLSGLTKPEFVEMKNFGTASQDLTGWTLVSVVGPQTYDFPAGFVLNPGATVRIESYTGAANNPPAVLKWTDSAVWANTGDKAQLRSASSTLISSACYLSGCP